MGEHYHRGDAFAYILEGTMLLERTIRTRATAPLKFLVFHVWVHPMVVRVVVFG